MGVWDTATPAGSDPISQGDDRIRETKAAIQEALRGGATDGDEAIFPGAAPSTAPIFRYRGLKGSTAQRPSASQGGLYYNTTTGTIQRANGTTWDDLTENAAFEAIHAAVAASLASVGGVVTFPETGNSFNVTGTEAITSLAGWSAGIVIVKWVSSRVITHGASLVLKNALSRTVAASDISVFEFTGANAVREIGYYGDQDRPARTTQYLKSGTSASYTTPTGCKKIVVKMRGGGAGGAAADTNSGVDGSDSSFNSIVAKGGTKGLFNGANGAGGTGGSGSADLRVDGVQGPRENVYINANGQNSPANSGAGGTGGNYNSGARAGGSGGGGEYVEFSISSPAASYTYTVGAGGAGGAAGTQSGGNGGSGLIVVEEYY